MSIPDVVEIARALDGKRVTMVGIISDLGHVVDIRIEFDHSTVLTICAQPMAGMTPDLLIEVKTP